MGISIGSGGVASGSGDAGQSGQTDLITQLDHGFVSGQVVRWSGAEWVLAQADTAANAGDGYRLGFVESPTANTFLLRTSGRMARPGHGFDDHVELFLSSSTAGGLMATAPEAPAVSLPVATVIDGGTIEVNVRTGSVLSAEGGGAGGGGMGGATIGAVRTDPAPVGTPIAFVAAELQQSTGLGITVANSTVTLPAGGEWMLMCNLGGRLSLSTGYFDVAFFDVTDAPTQLGEKWQWYRPNATFASGIADVGSTMVKTPDGPKDIQVRVVAQSGEDYISEFVTMQVIRVK